MPEEVKEPVAAEGGEPAASEIPAGLQKFAGEDGQVDVDKLGKSYLEMEALNTRKAQGQEEEGGSDLTIPTTPELTDEDGIETIIERAGLTRETLAEQIVNNEGKLTDDQYAKFKEQGWTRKMVDQVISQQVQLEQASAAKIEAAHEANKTAAVKIIGGDKGTEQQLQNLLQWAKNNLSEAEIAQHDEAVSNPATELNALRALYQRHQEATAGKGDSLITGDAPAGVASTEGYTTNAEFLQEKNDPRYKTDKNFRNAVEARIAKTNFSILR